MSSISVFVADLGQSSLTHPHKLNAMTFNKLKQVKQIGWRAILKGSENNIIIYGGYAAYSVLLALFPFLIFLIAVAGLLGNSTAAEALIESSMTMLPVRVNDVLLPVLHDLLNQESPGLLTFGIIATLWVTSSGVEGLRFGLNTVYGINELRPYWKRRLQSICIVVVGSIAFFLLAIAVIIWPLLIDFIHRHFSLSLENIASLTIFRFLLATLLLVCLFGVIYRVLPNRKHRWRDVLPGATIAAIFWIFMAQLFSVYLARFGHYDATYGSIGGLIITLMFFHYSATIILFGAQFNIVLEEFYKSADSKNIKPPDELDTRGE